MTKLVTGDGRTHIHSGLMRESLVSSRLLAETERGPVRTMVPDVSLVAIGGQSIIDRGGSALLPLVEAIAKLSKQHKMVVGVGGGARVRHTLAIGLDLGLPVGGLARIVGGAEEQNRDIVQFLLAPHGGVCFIKDHFQDLQLFLSQGMIPVCIGQPPYHFWEPPPRDGRLPDNGSDVGLFLMAEIIGAAPVIYVKDVDGVYTADPAKHDDAQWIPRISARELLDMALPDLPVERELLHTLERARSVTRIRVINGLDPENLRRALAGEDVGTVIHSSRSAQAADR